MARRKTTMADIVAANKAKARRLKPKLLRSLRLRQLLCTGCGRSCKTEELGAARREGESRGNAQDAAKKTTARKLRAAGKSEKASAGAHHYGRLRLS